MSDNPIHSTDPYPRRDVPPPVHKQRNAALLGGGALLLALGIAGGMMFSRNANDNEAQMDFPPPAAGVTESGTVIDPALQQPSSNVIQDNDRQDATTQKRRSSSSSTSERTSTSAGPREYESRKVAKAAICSYCGVVESVTAVPVQNANSGVGAVAGGVLGGVVGNQVGKGSGNTAATVLGAIGGGIAGNEIEKRQRTATVYRVKVRMDDGTTKTFTRQTEVPAGSKVEVHDGEMKLATEAG